MKDKTLADLMGKKIYVETLDPALYIGTLEYVPESKQEAVKLSNARKLNNPIQDTVTIPLSKIVNYGIAWRGLRDPVYTPQR